MNNALNLSPLILVFLKTSCTVCQFAFPYLERIYKAYNASGKFTFVGVSQNKASETKDFNSEFGVIFPTLMDDTSRYPASNAYGLTNVPSTFMVSPEGEIEFSIVD